MLKYKKYFFIISLLTTISSNTFAQKQSKAIEIDTVKVNFINGIAVHGEMVGAIQMLTSDHGQWEAGLRVNIKDKYFPAFELGLGKSDQQDEYIAESWYKTSAPFFRIGCDYNILRNKHDIYKVFVGVRYGFSKFSYDTTVPIITTVADDPATTVDESSTTKTYTEYNGLNATYHWLEGVFGVDAKIFGPLHLGWEVRYKRALTNNHSEIATPWYIPGFGNDKTAGFIAAFNLTFSF